MKNKIVDLTIDDGEEEAGQNNLEEDELVSSFEFCLFGCFLTVSVVHFKSMLTTLANI